MQLSNSAQKKVSNWLDVVRSDVLLPYQREYLTDTSPRILWRKSRQIGITWVNALKSSVERATDLVRYDHIFSSKDEDTAITWLGYCYTFCEQINFLLGEEVVPLSQWTKSRGIYANGASAVALSSNPKALRSNKGKVTLDEFDFHPDQREIYKAAEPCLSWVPGAPIELISSRDKTPGTVFEGMCRDCESGADTLTKYYRITLLDAVKQGLALKIWKHRIPEFPDAESLNAAYIAHRRSMCLSDEDFAQEYLCESPSTSALIVPDQYDKLVLRGPDGKPLPVPTTLKNGQAYGELYVGIDCGRVHDLTVVWVLEKGYDSNPKTPPHLRDVFRPVCVQWMRNMPFPAQLEVIRDIVSHPAICKGFIDMGSVGRALADAVQDETGTVIEAYAMTPSRMAKMAERLRAFVQQERIAQHPDEFVRKDVLSCRRDTVLSPSGSPRLVYQGSTATTHADFWWAQCLALEAACHGSTVTMETYSPDEIDGRSQAALPV